jgi:hypothetical protein
MLLVICEFKICNLKLMHSSNLDPFQLIAHAEINCLLTCWSDSVWHWQMGFDSLSWQQNLIWLCHIWCLSSRGKATRVWRSLLTSAGGWGLECMKPLSELTWIFNIEGAVTKQLFSFEIMWLAEGSCNKACSWVDLNLHKDLCNGL